MKEKVFKILALNIYVGWHILLILWLIQVLMIFWKFNFVSLLVGTFLASFLIFLSFFIIGWALIEIKVFKFYIKNKEAK